ncbi:MAG: hypothetical protein MHPSP_004133, partial [Paramarteilia canceri]
FYQLQHLEKLQLIEELVQIFLLLVLQRDFVYQTPLPVEDLQKDYQDPYMRYKLE